MARKTYWTLRRKIRGQKLALRRMILRKLATRRLAARKTAALGMVMLLLGGCHVAQLTTLYTDETSVEENGIRYDAAHRPITGVYQKYADNMQLQEEIHYVDGKISGLYKAYDRDGSVLLEAYYKKGSRTAKPWNIILTARKRSLLLSQGQTRRRRNCLLSERRSQTQRKLPQRQKERCV